jgi:transposase
MIALSVIRKYFQINDFVCQGWSKGMTDNNKKHHISDEIWNQIKPLLPPEFPRSIDSYLKIDSRKAMEAIFYMLYTDCKWDEIPANMGSGEEIYNRFRKWSETGVFERIWQVGILTYNELRKLVFSR